MGTQKGYRLPPAGSASIISGNKLQRQRLFVSHKKVTGKERRDARLRRRKEETNDPELRRRRLEANAPITVDKKRTWDDTEDDSLGAVVDLALLKRRRIEREEAEEAAATATARATTRDSDEGMQDDIESLLGSDDEGGDRDGEGERFGGTRDASLAPSTTSTNLDLTPSSLALKFPTLFTDGPHPMSKILVTTSLNSTLHKQAHILCDLFPNSHYVPRSSHRYGHKYSLRDISKFATNREYTAVVVLREDLKQPSALDIVHLPSGPTLQFSISNFVEGKKLPGHGNPTGHYPELLLNNFKTPLGEIKRSLWSDGYGVRPDSFAGLLTAKVFQTLFPAQSEIVGRTVVSISNQRDYLFLRRYRYVYREKRLTEKPAVSADGKEIPGGVRVGLQVLGPNIHLKLRRVYRGIGRAGSEGEDGVQWEWKARMEKTRTRFNL